MALSQVDPSQNLVSPKESYLCLYVYKGNLDECKYLNKGDHLEILTIMFG